MALTSSSTIEINLNDSTFLAAILEKWMVAEDMETEYLKDLAAHLRGVFGTR